MTRNRRDAQFTIERLAHDCLDIRELRRRGFLTDRRVEIGPSIRWSKIARMTIERYRIQLNFRRQAATQYARVSWTKVHLGGARPWMPLPALREACGEALRWPWRLLLPRLHW